MDLYKAIRALYDEKKRLDKLIESLEELHARGNRTAERPVTRSRRGRKKMSAAERLEVSERMKKYWAARREKPAGSNGEPSAETNLAAMPDIQSSIAPDFQS